MMAKTPIYIINSLYLGPALGQLGCSVYGFVGGLTGTTSILTLASIALDRYYAIAHPLNPFKQTTSRRAIYIIFSTWVYAAVFSTLPLVGVNNYTSEGYLTSCSFDYLSENITNRIFVFVFFLAAWFLPLAIITFSYLGIFRIVQAAEKMEIFEAGNAKQSAGVSFKFKKNRDKQKSDVKIAVLAAILISLWIISWTPYALVALLGICGRKSVLTPIVSAVPALFCKTASCVNPFVYAINHPRFQRELRSLFSFCSQHQHIKRKGSRQASYYSAVTCGENQQAIECRSYSVKRNSSLTSSERAQTANAIPNSCDMNKSSMKPCNKINTVTETQRHLSIEQTTINRNEIFPLSAIENMVTECELSDQIIYKKSEPTKYTRFQSSHNVSASSFIVSQAPRKDDQEAKIGTQKKLGTLGKYNVD